MDDFAGKLAVVTGGGLMSATTIIWGGKSISRLVSSRRGA